MVTKAKGILTPSLREEDPCIPFLQLGFCVPNGMNDPFRVGLLASRFSTTTWNVIFVFTIVRHIPDNCDDQFAACGIRNVRLGKAI